MSKTAQELFDEGWRVTSRQHRLVARLPPGMTAVEALIQVVENQGGSAAYIETRRKWAKILDKDGSAGSHYRRCYAPPELKMTVTRAIIEQLVKLAHAAGEKR
jgi:hypothetical protein